MTERGLIIEEENEFNEDETGRVMLFWNHDYPETEVFSFSSTMENIPVRELHDCSLKNKTQVFVLSEPTEAWHPAVGHILVSKVLAGNEIMWTPTHCLVPITLN